jgi:tetratricopeptide (TPR) repeat protein
VLALEICTMLAPFWFGTMRVSVGWEMLARAVDAAGEEDRDLRSSALVWALVFSAMVHDVEAAARLADEAYSYEQSVGDPARLGRICFARALAAGYLGDQSAADWVERARNFFAVTDSAVELGHVSFAEGAVRLVEGDLDGAMTRLRDAIDVFRHERDHLGLILAVSRLGELAWRRGDLELFAEMHAALLELGREGRSSGVTTGATARLALARLEQGALDEAQALARAALESSSESFMPVVNGYAFKTAGLVDLRMGHIAEGRSELHAAIDAFERGAGNVGVGQAAMCWIDLSRSHSETGELEDARRSAEMAVEVALAAGDPWIQGQARAQLALVAPVVALPS